MKKSRFRRKPFKQRRGAGRKRWYNYGKRKNQSGGMLIYRPRIAAGLRLPYPDKYITVFTTCLEGYINSVGSINANGVCMFAVKANSVITPFDTPAVGSVAYATTFTSGQCGGVLTAAHTSIGTLDAPGLEGLLKDDSSLYQGQRVYASSIKVTVVPQVIATAGSQMDVTVYPASVSELNTVSFAAATSPNRLMFGRMKSKTVQASAGISDMSIYNYCDHASLYGTTRSEYSNEDAFIGGASTDPASLALWVIAFQNPFNQTTSVVSVKVEIKHYCELSLPKRNAQMKV